MLEFKEYQRKEKAQLREVNQSDIDLFAAEGKLRVQDKLSELLYVSISQQDLENGSPKIGDMIARNPKNDKDQWLVSENYFNENFEK